MTYVRKNEKISYLAKFRIKLRTSLMMKSCRKFPLPPGQFWQGWYFLYISIPLGLFKLGKDFKRQIYGQKLI